MYVCVTGGTVSDGQANAAACQRPFYLHQKRFCQSLPVCLAYAPGGADAKKLLETLQTQTSEDVRRSALMLQQQVKIGIDMKHLWVGFEPFLGAAFSPSGEKMKDPLFKLSITK